MHTFNPIGGGSCLLKASVRVGNDNLKPQTQLQLLCNKTHNCSVTTTFDSCNIYDALEIDSGNYVVNLFSVRYIGSTHGTH